MSAGAASVNQETLTHPAFFYRSDTEYVDGLLPFLTGGIAEREPVAAIVPGPKLRLLRAALNGHADKVTMLDMLEVGRNPGRIIASVLRNFADSYPEHHVRIVGEPVWPGRTDAEYAACVQHESLINSAFTGRDVTIVCPYDAGGLDSRALSDAHATHPLVWQEDGRVASAPYSPELAYERYNRPLADSARARVYPVHATTDLPLLRGSVAADGVRLGLTVEQAGDLELIVTELATNSLVHAESSCELRLWREADHVVCDARDTGRFTDPLAGRRPPQPAQPSGRGLLLVNDLADLVRLHTADSGTTIQAHLRLRAR